MGVFRLVFLERKEPSLYTCRDRGDKGKKLQGIRREFPLSEATGISSSPELYRERKGARETLEEASSNGRKGKRDTIRLLWKQQLLKSGQRRRSEEIVRNNSIGLSTWNKKGGSKY